jgi:hypothetical protein
MNRKMSPVAQKLLNRSKPRSDEINRAGGVILF